MPDDRIVSRYGTLLVVAVVAVGLWGATAGCRGSEEKRAGATTGPAVAGTEPAPAAAPAEIAGGADSGTPVGAQTAPAALARGEDVQSTPERREPGEPLWAMEPGELQVYRDTRVTFAVTNAAAFSSDWTYIWDFGDGSPRAEGVRVEHLYRGGQTDHLATLQVLDGERQVYQSTRPVKLERLPVVPLSGKDDGFAPDLSIPPPPKPGDTSFRAVIISDSNGPYGSVQQGPHVTAAIRRITQDLRPELVIHNGDMIAGQRRGYSRSHIERMWEGYHEAVTYPLLKAGLPFVPAPGNHDAAPGLLDRTIYKEQWSRQALRPDVTFVDTEHYPLRFSFTHKGAFFLVMDGAVGRVNDEQIRWLRAQLESARIYTARFVFSHVPLHKFTDARYGDIAHPEGSHEPLRETEASDYIETPGLEKHFRLYNLFLETNVTLFFSSHYEVYFKGRYGALRVVSTGNIAGVRRALSGDDRRQNTSFVVMDVEDGAVKRVFALRGPKYDRRYDENELPSEVEVYEYDPTFSPGYGGGDVPTGVFRR